MRLNFDKIIKIIKALFEKVSFFRPIVNNISFLFDFVVYSIILLNLRAFFMADYQSFVYVISTTLFLLKYFGLITLPYQATIIIWLYIGFSLITYDLVASLISTKVETYPNAIFSTSLLITLNYKKGGFIRRYVSTKALFGLVADTTKMSSTGRAAILTGVISGVGYLANEHMTRNLTREIEQGKLDLATKQFDQQKYADERAAKITASQAWWGSWRK